MRPAVPRRVLAAATLVALAALVAGPGAPRALTSGAGPLATALPVTGAWVPFTWGEGTPVLSPTGPFTFTYGAPVAVTVVDVACKGDEFRVLDGGVTAAYSTAVVDDPECDNPVMTSDPSVALEEPGYSRAVFLLPAGPHSLDIEVTVNAPGDNRGYIKAEPAGTCPAPAGAAARPLGNTANGYRESGPAPAATTVTVGSGWVPFSWGAGLPECAAQGPFTFSHATEVVVTVTDAYCRGDRFRVHEAGATIGYTTVVPNNGCPDPTEIDDPDAALASGTYSSGTFTLPAGSHTVYVELVANPFGGGGAFLRVDPASGTVGGRDARLTAGPLELQWAPGTLQQGYVVLRATVNPPATALLGPLSADATSYADVSAAPGLMHCYAVLATGSGSVLGSSDVQCAQTGLQSGTLAPTGFRLALNQSTTASLSWTPPPGGVDSYALIVVPVSGAPPFPIALGGAAASATHDTGGDITCYLLVAVKGADFGTTNLVCGIPGMSSVAASDLAPGLAGLPAAVQGLAAVTAGVVAAVP